MYSFIGIIINEQKFGDIKKKFNSICLITFSIHVSLICLISFSTCFLSNVVHSAIWSHLLGVHVTYVMHGAPAIQITLHHSVMQFLSIIYPTQWLVKWEYAHFLMYFINIMRYLWGWIYFAIIKGHIFWQIALFWILNIWQPIYLFTMEYFIFRRQNCSALTKLYYLGKLIDTYII